MSAPRYRIGYCTSGLTLHRLDDALRLLADLGYRGVFLTLDVHHLDPFAPDLPRRVDALAALLVELDLEVVIETGARYLLDPRRKHWPTLLAAENFEPRVELLDRALTIARDLGGRCISTWSGTPDEKDDAEIVWQRLTERLHPLLELAQQRGVRLGFEPEPGMLVETVPDWHRLRADLGTHQAFGLSLDCGHLLVTGEGAPQDVLLEESEHLVAVAIEDMKRGLHEHLPFGEGDLDLPPLVDALARSSFDGVVAVELGRHAHEGPRQATRSRDILSALGVPFAR